MDKNTIKYTSFALNILTKALGSNFKISGLEKLPNKPVLFVANHFTRSETFFLPYLIYKNTGRQIRCLADSSLFKGFLGNFLSSVGAVSTSDKNRDKIILNDLVNANYDWMIYPEGSMIKNKKIDNNKGYTNYTPQRIGDVRTGSAVLGLKSEIYRDYLVKAYENNDEAILANFEKNFNFGYNKKLADLSTYIVPVSITYYPLRPGENKIKNLLTRFLKDIPKQILEEFEIEGNFLLGAEINVRFNDPISLKDYIKNVKYPIDRLPIIGHEFKSNLIIKYFKNKLTYQFMKAIYHNIKINFDHLFAATLFYLKDRKVTILQLKQIIYLAAITIDKLGGSRLNDSVRRDNIIKIFSDEKCKIFDDVFALAKVQKIIEVDQNNMILVRKDAFVDDESFHRIRLENSLKVVLNEVLLLKKPNFVIKHIIKTKISDLGHMVFSDIFARDLENYETDYQSFFDKEMSKNKEIGRPFTLNCQKDNKVKIGFLIIHGYKSAPKEVEDLAYFLEDLNFKIYAVRLKGHGTSPVNLKCVKWQDWYDSVDDGYCALRNIVDKIIVIGFSTGGLLSLMLAANKNIKNSKISNIISINSALRLRDIRSHLVPGINLWNDVLDRFRINRGRFDYIDNDPENPHINYSRNYLSGVEELGKLMSKVEAGLHKIRAETLIIQGDKDPVVNPKSADIIYKKIKNAKKEMFAIDSNRHVIVTGEVKSKTFSIIKNYLAKTKIISY